MVTKAGNCVLSLKGERVAGLSFALEWNDGSQAFGFLSGPVEILRKARAARRVNLELDDGTKLPATMLEVNRAGMALVSIDPKTLPASGDKSDK
jgi:hypothetical protein